MKRIKDSFEKQEFMRTLGARLESVEPGRVVISCSDRTGLTQQHGYYHAGVLTSIADSACGYAALTSMPDNADVLSVEFKINLLRPCDVGSIRAVGSVLKNGRTLVVCEGVVTDPEGNSIFAKILATMIVLRRSAD